LTRNEIYPPVASAVAIVANWHSRYIDQPITNPSDGSTARRP
jgi:hypothetical protein